MYNITRRYSFEAGHWLPNVPDGHRCKRKHGHNYEFDVRVSGELESQGFVIDFWQLDYILDPIIWLVDHQMLNEIPGLENPTAENIAKWFAVKIERALETRCKLIDVTVYETKNCWATYVVQ